MPKKHKKWPSKFAHNWLGLAVFSPASFCFVQLKQFYSLKKCQILQDEKIAYFYDACALCNSILLYSTQLPIVYAICIFGLGPWSQTTVGIGIYFVDNDNQKD